MKHILLSLVMSFAAQVAAQELHVTSFGGVNNTDDPYVIADTDAQDAANVLTEEGDLRTMPGSVVYYDVGESTISYLGEMVDDTGRRIIIAQSGAKIIVSSGTGDLTTIKTLSTVRDIDAVGAFNRFYFVDGIAPFYFNGSSVTMATDMEPCRYIEFYANRLVCANTSTDTAKIRISAYNAPTTWTVSTTADSAVIKYFNKGDGQQIRCLKSTPYGLFVGKDTSSGILKGDDADTFYWYTLSSDIGCVDDRSVQVVDGAITWLSQDGVYAWPGSGRPALVSREIRNTTKHILASSAAEQSWAVSSQSGWKDGTGAGWDYDIVPGNIKALSYNSGASTQSAAVVVQLSTNIGFNDGTVVGWTDLSNTYPYYCGTHIIGGTEPTVLIGKRIGPYWLSNFTGGTPIADVRVLKDSDNSVLSSSTLTPTTCLDHTFTGISNAYAVKLQVRLSNDYMGCSQFPTSTAFTLTGSSFSVRACRSGGNIYFDVFDSSTAYLTTISTPAFDSGLSTVPVYAVSVLGTNVRVKLSYSSDNVTFSTSAAPGRYVAYQVQFSSGVSVSSLTSVTISVLSSSTYSSPVYDVGSDISAWKNFSVSGTESEVNLSSFQVRGSTFIFTADSIFPAWVTQANNASMSAPVARFIQYRILPNITVSTQALSFASSLVGWTNGTTAPRVASVASDGHYLLCVSTASTVQNDICLLWQKNKKWMLVTGPSYGALALYNNKPIAGDGTSGSKIWNIFRHDIYKYDDQAIDSYWISKDFTFGKLNAHKVLDKVWISADNSPASIFNVGWQKDRDGVWVSSATSLNESSFVVKELQGLFLDEKPVGRQFRFKFSNSEYDKWFRLKLYSIYYHTNPLIQ